MPKPILSDSLFNASDVSEAIVDTIDLGVINTNLGVVDRSSIITATTGFAFYYQNVYSFNGFMFVSIYIKHDGSGVTTEQLGTITDSSFYPRVQAVFPTVSHQGDLAQAINFNTDGTIIVDNPVDAGTAGWWSMINGFYRFGSV
tara:strand:- start:2022 stop:2453 length:432 start_codon:yes stop_codon:yes gene_type:complete